MNLFVLRHGLAGEHGELGLARDSERPLTPKGERKLWRITQAMEEMELSFDVILTSPYVRARQTAEIVSEAFGLNKKLECTEHLTPSGSSKKLIDFIAALKPLPENVLLAGHEPYLSELISLLLTGETKASILMKKGGLCKLSADALHHGRCATLEWLLTPKQMCLMA